MFDLLVLYRFRIDVGQTQARKTRPDLVHVVFKGFATKVDNRGQNRRTELTDRIGGQLQQTESVDGISGRNRSLPFQVSSVQVSHVGVLS